MISVTDRAKRLLELSRAVTKQDWSEFTMRVPAQLERDADLVLADTAGLIVKLNAVVQAAAYIPCKAGAVISADEAERLQAAFDDLHGKGDARG